jgi:hypothetical protein
LGYYGAVETIQITDANTGALLDGESYSGFHNGEYAVWNMRGNVLIQVAKFGGANGVVSGIFFDWPPPSAALTGANASDFSLVNG